MTPAYWPAHVEWTYRGFYLSMTLNIDSRRYRYKLQSPSCAVIMMGEDFRPSVNSSAVHIELLKLLILPCDSDSPQVKDWLQSEEGKEFRNIVEDFIQVGV